MNPEADPKKVTGIVAMFQGIPRLDINGIMPKVVLSAKPIQGVYENIRAFTGAPVPLENTPGFKMYLRKIGESHDDKLIVDIDISPREFHKRALEERVEGDDELMRLLIGTYLRQVEVDFSNHEIPLEEYKDVECRVRVYAVLTGFFQNRIDEFIDIGDLLESHRDKFPEAGVEINWENKWGQEILQVYKWIHASSTSYLDTLRLISNEEFLEPNQIEQLCLGIADWDSFLHFEKKHFNVLFL